MPIELPHLLGLLELLTQPTYTYSGLSPQAV
jgi:hypothetical protein